MVIIKSIVVCWSHKGAGLLSEGRKLSIEALSRTLRAIGAPPTA